VNTHSLGCEAKLVGHGFDAALDDDAAAGDFVAKVRELGSAANGFKGQRREVISDQIRISPIR
jgi:hypothetical protein